MKEASTDFSRLWVRAWEKMHSTGFALKADFYILRFNIFGGGQTYRKEFSGGICVSLRWMTKAMQSLHAFCSSHPFRWEKRKTEGARLSFPGNYQPWRDEEQKFHHCNSRDKRLAPLQSQTTVCDDVEEKSLSALSNFPTRKGCARGSYHSLIAINIQLPQPPAYRSGCTCGAVSFSTLV